MKKAITGRVRFQIATGYKNFYLIFTLFRECCIIIFKRSVEIKIQIFEIKVLTKGKIVNIIVIDFEITIKMLK